LPSILDADDVIDDFGRWRKHGAKMGSAARLDNRAPPLKASGA
jgi:hypothetical protein